MADQLINWFPGHMAKTKREMEQSIKLVDVVVELLDARAPKSSKNPYLDELWSRRPRVIALNKSDLADAELSGHWTNYYKAQGFEVVLLDSLHGNGLKLISQAADRLMKTKNEARKAKGMKIQPTKLMISGIPNVGKSTLINQMAKRSDAAKTGNKPGVTKSNQWIKLQNGMLLLDTPGILWPKFEDQEAALRLAFIGSISDEINDTYTLAVKLLDQLLGTYPKLLMARYKLSEEDLKLTGEALIEVIGRKRGHLKSGGEVDLERCARMLLDEFRNGKIGRITLEDVVSESEN